MQRRHQSFVRALPADQRFDADYGARFLDAVNVV